MSKPSIEEVITSESVCTLTPNKLNPYTKEYDNCEQNPIDWEDNVLDEDMASSMMIDSAKVRYMDTLEMDEAVMDAHPKYQMIPHDATKVASV
eukprot:11806725-Ditylum_brightwellii.AAC.1